MSVNEPDLPIRSESGKAALDIFYAGFNDVNFYVEDEEQENLYFEILCRLFKRVKIARIFPLGGKAAVFQHAKSGANQGINCFRAYIVDRDFDHLLGKQLEQNNIFYLDRFCVENHLLEQSAISEIVIENHPRKKRTEVDAKLAVDEQAALFFQCLRPIFTLFFLTQYLDLNVKNCSLHPEAFCEPRRLWQIKSVAIENYREQLRTAAATRGLRPVEFDSQLDAAISKVASTPDHKLVSGKFVAAMLFHYVKSKYNLGSMTFDSFVYRLAKNCALQSMRPLAIRVYSGIRSHSVGSPT